MAYGKKNTIDTDLSKVIFGLLGESGIGKSTTLFHMAETLFGDEGYILLDMGSEYGSEYIEGVVSEQVETFKKFVAIVDDICKNKEKDYPKLKVILADTLDALFEIGEPYLTKLYNQEHMGEKNFVPAKTINATEGGFMKGQDRLIDIVVEQIVKLRKVGVGFWYTGHVKRRSTDDVFSGDSYDQLTTSMSQRYFNAIKNKTHALGIAYINRDLTQQEIGKENPVTHKKNTITKIVSESRKVKFRDDSYTADSKSRLRYIVDEVNLDENEIIKALQDAIAEEKKNPYKVTSAATPTTKKTTKKSDPVVEEEHDQEDIELLAALREAVESAEEKEDDTPPFDVNEEIEDIFPDEETEDEDAMITLEEDRANAIRDAFRAANATTKAAVKKHLVEYGGKMSDTMKASDVNAIEEILGLNDEV
jgi:hypothetical protein